MARYDSNGSLDGTFGTGGIVTTAVGTDEDQFLLAAEKTVDADRPAEMPEIRAAAQSHVLTIVDRVTGRLVDERVQPNLDAFFGERGIRGNRNRHFISNPVHVHDH